MWLPLGWSMTLIRMVPWPRTKSDSSYLKDKTMDSCSLWNYANHLYNNGSKRDLTLTSSDIMAEIHHKSDWIWNNMSPWSIIGICSFRVYPPSESSLVYDHQRVVNHCQGLFSNKNINDVEILFLLHIVLRIKGVELRV